MNNLKEIRFTIKKTEYCEVVINKEKGWDMPENIGDLVHMGIEIKNEPEGFIGSSCFIGEEYEIINDVEYIEDKK